MQFEKGEGYSYFNIRLAIKKLKKRVTPLLKGMIDSSTENGLKILNQNYNPEDWIERNGRLATENANRITESINTLDENIKEDIKRSLSRNAGRDAKDQLEKLISDTSQKFDQYYTKNRAETIARTSTTYIDNSTKRSTWSDMGVNELEWVTEGDDRVRDSHAAMDGVRVPIEGSFSIEIYDSNGNPTGEFTETPFPAGGQVASQDVNCRCTLLPII